MNEASLVRPGMSHDEILSAACALMEGEPHPMANMANMASLLWHTLPDLNWAGFYIRENDDLVLGPFHGKPACVRIPLSKGVCGAAARERKTQRVADVHQFPGHIACDAASRSEIVVPLLDGRRVFGVLDLDSPSPDRFTEQDQALLEDLAKHLIGKCHWKRLGVRDFGIGLGDV